MGGRRGRDVAYRGDAAPLVGRRRSAWLLRRPGETAADEARGHLGGGGLQGVDGAATRQRLGGAHPHLRGISKGIRDVRFPRAADRPGLPFRRSEERRVGKGGVRTCRSWWSPWT